MDVAHMRTMFTWSELINNTNINFVVLMCIIGQNNNVMLLRNRRYFRKGTTYTCYV